MGAKIDVICNFINRLKSGYTLNFTLLDSTIGETNNERTVRAAGRNFDLVNKSKEFADQFEPEEEYTLEFKPKK